METVLIAYDLWDVVEFSINNQSNPDESAEEGSEAEIPKVIPVISREMKIKNAKALSVIQGAITDELFPRIRNEKTAKGAWGILKREFRGDKKVRAAKLQAIRDDFEYMRMSKSDSLNNYLAKFFEVVNDFKSLGEEVTETRLVRKLLMSLCRRYNSIVSIIEETRDLDWLRIEEVIASVKVFDKREGMHDEREKQIGTERAFNTLRIGSNQFHGGNKVSHIKSNQV
ncbi:TMV resistance protein [Salix suchowensis]|nr:TMV resistance protein [Salix suchowensis]